MNGSELGFRFGRGGERCVFLAPPCRDDRPAIVERGVVLLSTVHPDAVAVKGLAEDAVGSGMSRPRGADGLERRDVEVEPEHAPVNRPSGAATQRP